MDSPLEWVAESKRINSSSKSGHFCFEDALNATHLAHHSVIVYPSVFRSIRIHRISADTWCTHCVCSASLVMRLVNGSLDQQREGMVLSVELGTVSVGCLVIPLGDYPEGADTQAAAHSRRCLQSRPFCIGVMAKKTINQQFFFHFLKGRRKCCSAKCQRCKR